MAHADTIEFQEESLCGSPPADFICLLVLALFISFWGIASGPELSEHETIVAIGAGSMRESGNWLIPRVGNEDFIRKPPLGFWLAAGASALIDPPGAQPIVSRTAARLPSAIASVLTVFVVYMLGRSMFGRRAGVVSGVVMAVCGATMFFSHNAQVEMVLALCCTSAFAFFWLGTEAQESPRPVDCSTTSAVVRGQRSPRRWLFLMLFYVSCALAMLAKAPLPLAVVGLPLAVWWFVVVPVGRLAGVAARTVGDASADRVPTRLAVLAGQGRRFLGLWLVPGTLLFLVIFLPWPLYVYKLVPNATELWKIEFLDRYSGELSGKEKEFWYYLPITLGFVFPFTLSLPEAFAAPFLMAYRDRRKPLLFLLTWAVVQIAFLSTSSFKRPHYLVVSLPAFALLLGPVVDRLFLSARTMPRRAVIAASWGLSVGVAVAAVGAGFWMAREHPQVLGSFRPAGIALAGGIVAACLLFALRRRAASLALVIVSAAATFALSWGGIGSSGVLDERAEEMIAEMRERSIGADDRVTWTIGRPDSRLEYRMGLTVGQLFTPLELAPLREGRSSIPPELLMQGVARVKERLGSAEEEYFIIKGKYWDRITGMTNLEAREVCRIDGEFGDPSDDWVLITNPWNTGEEEDAKAGG